MRPWGLALPGALVLAALPLSAQAQTFQLPSGLRCVLLEKHDQPLIRMELSTRWPATEEPARGKGMAGFLAAVLRAGGAGPYARPEFNRALDDLGIAFTFEARRNAYCWTLATDSRSQEPAAELLADAVFRPAFDGPLVEAQRLLLAKRAAEAPLWDQGRTRFLWSLGDEDTPLPPGFGGLEQVTYADLLAFRRRVVRPEASTLVLHGDLSLSQAKELVNLHFGLWGPGPEPSLGEPGPAPGGPRLLAELDGSPDTELWAGCERACPPEVGELLDLLLEQVPAVVSPGVIRACSLGAGRPLLVSIKAGPGAKDGLVEALLATLETLRGAGFSDLDVTRARVRWQARAAVLPLHPRDQVRRYREGVLAPDFQRRVEAVGAREVNDALKAMLAPGRLRFLLLGGTARLLEGAEKAGLGPAEPLKPIP